MANKGDRYGTPRPITMRCRSCSKPYDLVAVTENKRGKTVYCPKCGETIAKVT